MNASVTPALRVVIVDDEAPARARLRDLLGDCHHQVPHELVGEAASGREALDLLQRVRATVVLLDVRMPEMDGLELAGHLAALPAPPAVVFVTAYDEFAVRAFDLHAVDYLMKPVRAARLAEALSRASHSVPLQIDQARALADAPRRQLSVTEGGRVHLVPVDEVLYFKAELKYVTIRTQQREYLIEDSLMQLEQEFAERFVRIHRNCIVARAAIVGFERLGGGTVETHWVAILRGVPERLAISRRQQHVVREFSR